MSLKCQICNINQSKPFLTKCCKIFICQQCKNQYQNNQSQCVCNKTIQSKRLCNKNQELHQIICQYQNKKQKQCDRCSASAFIECKSCNMIFCKDCQVQLHSETGYSKHVRYSYVARSKSVSQIMQMQKNKIKTCQSHKILIEFACQCGNFLCSLCLKSHKQNCPKLSIRPKTISEFRNQYYSQIIFKMSQITSYKESLQRQQQLFREYFNKQSQQFFLTQKSLKQQFSSLRKMLDIKIQQSEKHLTQYWQQYQKVYKKTQYYLEYNMIKYDQYAKMIQKFAQKQIGLDYLQKRIKKTTQIDYNAFCFKLNNIQQLKNSIMSINSSTKTWQYQFHDNILTNLEQFNQQKKVNYPIKKSDLLNQINPSEQLFQVSKNPLKSRNLTLNSSHNQIQFSFLHLPYHTNKYQIQYGVGFKMKGKQVFKKIQNTTGNGLIQNLNPSTKYRIRMKVSQGQFGQIKQITTLDTPKFYVQPSNIIKINHQNSFQFLKQGIVYGINPISFGIHYWTIILNSQKSSYEQSQTACLSLGISNKQQKKPIFVGSTFNYGYQREQIVIKVILNCIQQTMVILSSQLNQAEEKFNNLPGFPIFPTIQNKSSTTVHLKYFFGKDQNL